MYTEKRMRYLIFISKIYDYNKYNENSCVSEQYKKEGVFVVYVYLFMESQINVDMCIMQYFPSLYNVH